MLTLAILGLLLQRRRLTLTFLIGGAMFLWYGMAHPEHTKIDPRMKAGTQKDAQSGISHPDFRGDWKLDLEASDSVAPLLRAAGKSEWTISLASKVTSTHIIRGDLHRLTLRIETPVRTQEQEIPLDGTPTRVTGPDGSETLASTRWSEDGQALITTTQASSQQPLSFRITRSLDADRRTMFLDVECQGRDGQPIRVRRVYRLVALPAYHP
jgi:hypothetical protein